MFDKRTLRQDFGGAAAGYDEHALLQREVREHAQGLAEDLWPEGARILDVGSGTGAFAMETAGKGWRITGLDIAYGMCVAAKNKNLYTINASAEAIPFADGTFDGVFSSLMLQWASAPVEIFKELHRVLKPSGCAVITTFVSGTLKELNAAFAAVDSSPHVSHFPEIAELFAQARAVGFSIVNHEGQQKLEYYPSLMTLMHSLKNIGAGNKDEKRRRGLMTPRQLARVREAYPKDAASSALPASWYMLYMVLQKHSG